MKRTTLFLGFSFALLGVFCAQQSFAQQHYDVAPRFETIAGNPVSPTNYHKDYLKRFVINQPASVAGVKVYTIANNGRGAAGEWGRAIDSVWNNVTLVKVNPADACASITNGGAISGNWAFIRRGDCEFGEKALKAQQAGAKGVIIANNVTGGPVGMGAGGSGTSVIVPVLMISKEDGDAIETELDASNTVTLSLSPWSLGATHDLGILPSGGALWHAYAIPRYQMASDNGNPGAYQMLTGAFIGNFGTEDETNVKIKNVISFTPDGGSATVLKEDSIEIPSFAVADSIMYGFTDDRTDFHATANGRLDATYTLTYDSTDQREADNEVTFSSYVSDSIYSIGRYDFAAGKPVTTSSFGVTNGESFIWGPMYYMAKGGRAIWRVQFTTSNGSATNPSLSGEAPFNLYVFEWTDADGDSMMTGGELKMVGLATKQFGTTDSSNQIFTAEIGDISEPKYPVIAKANTWYWVAADVPAGWFLGVDGYLNYYPRFFFGTSQATPFRDPYGPLFFGNISTLVTEGSTDQVNLMPFEPYFIGDSARFSQQANGLVPAMPLHMSKEDKTEVRDMPQVFQEISLYPNPASEALQVRLSLTEKSDKVYLSVLDAAGRNIMRIEKQQVLQETFRIPTGTLASGNYYLVINTDKGNTVRKFTVEKK